MTQSLLFAAIASAALVLGAFAGMRWTLPGTVLAALLAAIFASNFPEALVGARSMCDEGRSKAFAGGAVLASLANTVFPKAYKDGGPWVAFATVAGFLAAFTLGALGS